MSTASMLGSVETGSPLFPCRVSLGITSKKKKRDTSESSPGLQVFSQGRTSTSRGRVIIDSDTTSGTGIICILISRGGLKRGQWVSIYPSPMDSLG